MEPSGQKEKGKARNTWSREVETEMTKAGCRWDKWKCQPKPMSSGKESFMGRKWKGLINQENQYKFFISKNVCLVSFTQVYIHIT